MCNDTQVEKDRWTKKTQIVAQPTGPPLWRSVGISVVNNTTALPYAARATKYFEDKWPLYANKSDSSEMNNCICSTFSTTTITPSPKNVHHDTCLHDSIPCVRNNVVVCYFGHKIIDLFIKIYSSMCMNCVHVSYDNYWFRVNFGFMFFIWQMTWPKLRLWNMAVARCIDKWKQFEYLGGKCVADGCWNALEENTLTLIHTANEKNCVCEQYQKLFSALITNYY